MQEVLVDRCSRDLRVATAVTIPAVARASAALYSQLWTLAENRGGVAEVPFLAFAPILDALTAAAIARAAVAVHS